MDLLKRKYDAANKENKFEEVIKEVLQKHIYPEDEYEIVAILEANGWNDDRAAEELGAENLFVLADKIWRTIQNNISAQPFSGGPRMNKIAYVFMIIRSFLRGMIVAMPMALSVAAMLILKFSLWSFMNLSLELATSIALGTIMSFIATGGFTQAIARRGFLWLCVNCWGKPSETE